ncbi:MAG: hypothetical protein ABI140_11675 [Jatrophihabitantaceae bacterium]
MLIDCDTCAARDIHCGDCVVAVLLGPRGGSVELDSAEQLALDAFATGGLLPPLRLVPKLSASDRPPATPPAHRKPTRRDAMA